MFVTVSLLSGRHGWWTTVDMEAFNEGEMKLVNVPEEEQVIQWAKMGREVTWLCSL